MRKAAFECCDTLLDTCLAPEKGGQLEHLNAAPGYLAALATGLGDHYDIKMVAHVSLAGPPPVCSCVSSFTILRTKIMRSLWNISFLTNYSSPVSADITHAV